MKKGIRLLALLLFSVFVMGLAACQTTKAEEATEVQSTDTAQEEEKARAEQMELERLRAEEEERRWLEDQERLREQEANAQAEVASETTTEEPAGEAYDADTVLSMVQFDFDKYDIKDDYREVLAGNAEWINSHPDTQIQIEGHCDERGTDEYNLALGERRATAVKNYLASLGVDPSRIYTISYGEEMPLEAGHDEDAWAKNRRAQFKVTSR